MKPKRLRAIIAVALATLVMAGAALVLSGLVPRWTIGGTRMAIPFVIQARPADAIALSSTGLILFVGDSNTAGSRVGGVRNSYAVAFANALGTQGARATVHAFGGATVADLLSRPLPEEAVGLAFVMMGTNDAATRGWMSDKRRVPIEVYRRNLVTLVERLREKGAQVVILAPPPVGSSAMARSLDPYRLMASEVADDLGCAFRDPAAAFVPHANAAMLQRDALHLSPEAQRILGLWLVSQTINASVTGSSSTGKPKPSSASQPS